MRLRLLAEAAVSGACPDSELAMALRHRVACRVSDWSRLETRYGYRKGKQQCLSALRSRVAGCIGNIGNVRDVRDADELAVRLRHR